MKKQTITLIVLIGLLGVAALFVLAPTNNPLVEANNNTSMVTLENGSVVPSSEVNKESGPGEKEEETKEAPPVKEEQSITRGQYEAGRVTGDTRTVNGYTWYYINEPDFYMNGWYTYPDYGYVMSKKNYQY